MDCAWQAHSALDYVKLAAETGCWRKGLGGFNTLHFLGLNSSKRNIILDYVVPGAWGPHLWNEIKVKGVLPLEELAIFTRKSLEVLLPKTLLHIT